MRLAAIGATAGAVDAVMLDVQGRWPALQRVETLADVRALLEARAPGDRPATLDLVGHSTSGGQLLRFGEVVIDMCDPRVARFFERLAADAVLGRAGVIALRLLGCATATAPGGIHTMRRLASTLHLPVIGTRRPVGHWHYDAEGFSPAFRHLLLCAEPARLRAQLTAVADHW